MTSLSFDFQIGLKAYPYVAPQTSVPTVPSDGGGSALDALTEVLQDTISQLTESTADGSTPAASSDGDAWRSVDKIGDVLPSDTIKNIGKGLKGLETATKFLEKILSIMTLFMTGFNLVQMALSTLVKVTVKTLKDFSTDGLNFGIYLNFVASPAFYKKSAYKPDEIQKMRGGFPAFITRLQSSVNDPTDENRPTFKENDFVGGWVILIDSGKIDDIWLALNQLYAFFKDMGKFQLVTAPPPPSNLNGTCGFFTNPSEIVTQAVSALIPTDKPKFGIKLQWDNTYMSQAYRISRSIIPGGQLGEETYKPVTIMGDPEIDDIGLLPASWKMLKQIWNRQPITIPKKKTTVYRDPFFGKPVIIPCGFNKTVTYMDYAEVGTYKQVFYVVQSCTEDGDLVGPFSKELVVTIKKCNDMFTMADVIEQPNGSFEFLSYGVGKVGAWTSIQAHGMIPWFKDFMDILIGMVEGLSAMTGTASGALQKYIQSLSQRIQSITNTIRVLTYLLSGLKNFGFGSSIFLLKLGAREGGVNNFIQRVQSARLPTGDAGFSGPNGITMGLVAMYGAGGTIVETFEDAATVTAAAASAAATTAELALGSPMERATADAAKSLKKTADAAEKAAQKAKQKQVEIMSAAFDFIFKMFPQKK